MTIDDITRVTGCKIDKDGTYVVFEPHIFYPCIYLKDAPFILSVELGMAQINLHTLIFMIIL